MGKNHPSHSAMILSLSFRIGLGELRKTEQLKRNQSRKTEQHSLHNTHISPVQEGKHFKCLIAIHVLLPTLWIHMVFFFSFVDMYLMIITYRYVKYFSFWNDARLNTD